MSDWISVEDRLPEDSTDTLIVAVHTSHSGYLSDTDGFDVSTQSFAYWGRNGTVTHWMPLPPPPEVNNED